MNKDYEVYNAQKTADNGEKHGMPKQQRRILKWIFIFFGLMLLFTLLSRAADSITVPKVSVGSPVSNTLDFEVSASGVVEAKSEISLNMDAGYTIKDILVAVGDEVKAGDVLLTLDEEKMQQQLRDAEQALAEAELESKIAALNAETLPEGSAYDEQAKAYQRNLTDAELEILAEDRKIADAQDALEEARMELGQAEAKYTESQSKTYEERLKEAEETLEKAAKAKTDADITYNDSLRSANRALSDARDAYDKALVSIYQGSSSGGDGSDETLQQDADEMTFDYNALRDAEIAWGRAQEDYNDAIAKADRALQQSVDTFTDAQTDYNDLRNAGKVEESESVQSADAAVQTARKAVEEKERALKDAEDDKNQVIMKQERSQQDALEDLEDAREKDRVTEKNESIERQRSSLTAQQKALGMQKLVDAVEEARKTIEGGGQLLAPGDGVITAIDVSEGGKTTEESVMKMTDATQGYRFKVVMSTEDAKYLEKGDQGSIIPSGSQSGAEGAVVESMRALSGEDSGKTEIIASLPSTFTEAGLSATLKIEKRSGKYQVTVPISAVNGSGQDAYVLVLREKETVLGVEWFAEKRSVTILEKDSQYAALQPGSVDSREQIILQSSKPVNDGDRVRVNVD